MLYILTRPLHHINFVFVSRMVRMKSAIIKFLTVLWLITSTQKKTTHIISIDLVYKEIRKIERKIQRSKISNFMFSGHPTLWEYSSTLLVHVHYLLFGFHSKHAHFSWGPLAMEQKVRNIEKFPEVRNDIQNFQKKNNLKICEVFTRTRKSESGR